jgi:hypothetical protein
MGPKTIWTGVGVAAVATVILITNLFQPSGLKLDYDPQSYFEVRRLFFAAGVLAVLALMLLVSIAIYATSQTSNQGSGKDIFDSMIKVVPPIITLVLGYYFGQQSVVKGAEKAVAAIEQGAQQKKEADGKGTSTPTDQRDQSSPKAAPPKAPSNAQTPASPAAVPPASGAIK